ncbi:MAG: DUF72 domain-containing protein [Acidobacteriia bacterium]|nr:DUF72 domain-containing protein [Terriglobia bacterium]
MSEPGIRLGTSAFTAAGWPGSFYPAGMKPAEYLSHYATQFDTVELDSTFYRAPAASVVRGWHAKTPANFVFAAKVPQIITHEKMLVDCGEELKQFLGVMDLLGEKRGPLLFQFPYFNKSKFVNGAAFIARLRPFLAKLPADYRFAVEIRNKYWLVPALADALRERGVALALIDHSWMPPIGEVLQKIDPITADFTYIRWLGDRQGIEEQTKSWDKTIVDRRRELRAWAEACKKFLGRGIAVFAFANNHYAGHSPDTVRLFREILEKTGKEKS